MPIPVAKKVARNSRYRGLTYGLAPGLDFALCRALDLLLGFALAAGALLSLALLTAAFANAAESATQFYLLGSRANATEDHAAAGNRPDRTTSISTMARVPAVRSFRTAAS